jgi:hypothetical protein
MFSVYGVLLLYCIVQRRSDISHLGSLNKTMLNLKLYSKIYLFYDGVWVVQLFKTTRRRDTEDYNFYRQKKSDIL